MSNDISKFNAFSFTHANFDVRFRSLFLVDFGTSESWKICKYV